MSLPPNVTEELRNDVRFALRFKVGRKQQPLPDKERDMVAAAIVEHKHNDRHRAQQTRFLLAPRPEPREAASSVKRRRGRGRP
jgi:hypothetical protein